MKNFLITGIAGFIGFNTALRLFKKMNIKIYGIDNINDYYSIKLKKKRLNILKKNFKEKFFFKKINISDKKKVFDLFKKNKFHTVIHLAAQAGVRYSILNPDSYFESNLRGFYNILDLSKEHKVKHLILASTSSVYGENNKKKFKANIAADHPTQFYAATKRANEIMAHSYSHMFKIPITVLRFFTVYGPWGRTDMSLFLFVKNIYEKKKIYVFNYGKHTRDFTYIDDVTDGIYKALNKIPSGDRNWYLKKNNAASSTAPFRIFNIGSGKKIHLRKYISIIEKIIGKKAKLNMKKFQKGDIKNTLADITETNKQIKYKPKMKIQKGIENFISWYSKNKNIFEK